MSKDKVIDRTYEKEGLFVIFYTQANFSSVVEKSYRIVNNEKMPQGKSDVHVSIESLRRRIIQLQLDGYLLSNIGGDFYFHFDSKNYPNKAYRRRWHDELLGITRLISGTSDTEIITTQMKCFDDQHQYNDRSHRTSLVIFQPTFDEIIEQCQAYSIFHEKESKNFKSELSQASASYCKKLGID
jgi:hypothetical protein